jgi:ferrous iron transport protein A
LLALANDIRKRGENMKKQIEAENFIPLSKVSVGEKVQVVYLLNKGFSRRRMLDLGMIPNTIIEVLRKSPLGDPIAYNIRGATIALREEESRKIIIRKIDE